MSEEWASWLSDQAIRRTVGEETYRRGAAYFRDGRVSRLRVNPKPRALFATVTGNRTVAYQTLVTAGRGTGESGIWSGRCTCPMFTNCKHVAAVLLAARKSTVGPNVAGRAAEPSWERAIAEVVRTSAAGRDAVGAPLALQLEVLPPAQRAASAYGSAATLPAGPRIRLRPVIRGRSGAWVRTGVSWRDLQHSYGQQAAHREMLRELYSAYQVRANSYYSYGEQAVHLDQLGPSVWRLLERVLEAGVELVPAKASAGPIALAPGPARARLDLRREEEGGAATLAGVVEVDGRTVAAAAVGFLGNPIHGLFIQGDGGSTPGVSAAGAAPGLLLARLDRQPSESASGLLREGRPLVIPAGELGRFLSGYYPALRQAIDVVSSDASVTLPEIAPPRLALTVTHRPDQQTGLQWAFAYAVGDSIERLPLRGPTGTVGIRDVLAEQRVLERLELPDDRLPQLRAMVADQRLLVPDVALRGIDAAYFTQDLLPSLRENDDVLVEVEGTAPDYRYTDAAPLVQLSATESADDRDWFNLGVRVFIDGEEIPFQALFLALARGDSHLVLDSGTWFSIERPELDQLRRLIEEARSLQDRESDGLRISAYQAGLWEELTQLGVVEAQSARWASTVRGLLEVEDRPPPPVPQTLLAELRPYQVDGYHWLSFLRGHGLGGILADDMGLGKTVQTLAMICQAQASGSPDGPFLVVAPTSVVPNWRHEAARFAPHLKVAMVTETQARGAGTGAGTLAERSHGADVVVTSYALFRIDYEAYAALPWSGLILDEAQFVKNHQSKTYQCARRLDAPFKLAITGTPLENSLMDLWSLLSIVAPGLFPSPQRFTELYRKPIETGGAPELLATLRRRIRPLMRRRTKEQVATELPPKQEQVLEVVLNPRHQKIYQTHLQRERQKVLGLIDDLDKNRFMIFRSLTLLRQLSLDPALVDPSYAGVRSSKADAFLEQLEEVVSEGHRALVFSQFTGFLTTIRDRLDAEGVSYCYLDGRTRDRARCIEDFKNGDAPVFLISLKAGGFGLNLTEADYCFVLDPWWNPAAEAQAVDRAHRIGQDKTVMVYRFVATDTIEEKVMALKARKSDLFARVMDDDALLSAPLSANDIRSLLA